MGSGFYIDEYGRVRKISSSSKVPSGTIIYKKRPHTYSVHARDTPTTYFEQHSNPNPSLRDLGKIVARNEPEAYSQLQDKYPNEHDFVLRKLSRVIDPVTGEPINCNRDY